jgi:hypothetical protein
MPEVLSASSPNPNVVLTPLADAAGVPKEVEISVVKKVAHILPSTGDRGSSIYIAGNAHNASTASDDSVNLRRVEEPVLTQGVMAVAPVGFDRGALKDLVDEAIRIRTEYGALETVEDVHCVIRHAINPGFAANLPESVR